MGLLDALFNSDTYGPGGGILDLIRRTKDDYENYKPSPEGLPPPPATFADRFNALPNAPQPVIGSGRSFDAATFDPQTYAPNQAQPIAVGSNYMMPRAGDAGQYNAPMSAQATLPPNAQPTQGQIPEAPLPLPPAFGRSADGALDQFSNAMRSIGNGGGILSAIRGKPNDPVSIGQQNLQAEFHAVRQTLIDNGLTPAQANSKAMLAVMNKEAGKTILSEALTGKEKWGEIGSDSFGNKSMGWINERDQTINGRPTSGGSAGGESTGFLASGVKQVDSSLSGQDYLKQFSPEVQAAVQNYVEGKSMPTGNPRKGFTQTVKMIAQKYGADMGQTVDDATYTARRTMRNQLSSSSPSSLGGQINIGNTAAGHLGDLSQKALELGNWDTGIAPLTHAVNGIRGLTTEQAAKMEALKGAAQHYGQEITKFYAGSPGGVAERDRFIESVNGARSPKELAAILATEAELMHSRLHALGGQIKGVLGDEGMKQYPVLRPDGEAGLKKVEENVSRLKGGQIASGGVDRSAVEAEMRKRGLLK